MSRLVHFEDEAETEYRQAGGWYESRVDAAIRQVLEFPRIGAPVPRLPSELPVRRVAVRRFPYHVIYMEIAEALRILAVAHDRRRPGLLARTIAVVVRSIVSPTPVFQPRRLMIAPAAVGCKRWLAGSPRSLAVMRLRRASVCSGGECGSR